MKNFKQFLFEIEDYKMAHKAPSKEDGSPLYDLTDIYPADIYSSVGARYYGDNGGDSRDNQSISIIQYAHNKPNAKVKIFRAVPLIMSKQELLDKYGDEKIYIMKYGKIPKTADRFDLDKGDYYEYISDKLDEIESGDTKDESVIEINDGDWVTISKAYAIEHGKSSLGGKYRILSKTVMAKQLFSEGNSIHEWGYVK